MYKFNKKSQTNVLNDQQHYKTHTLFDTITYAGHTSNSASSTLTTGKSAES